MRHDTFALCVFKEVFMVDGDEWKNKTPWKCLEEQSVKKHLNDTNTCPNQSTEVVGDLKCYVSLDTCEL